MSKVCPNCKKEFSEQAKFCDIDGSVLIPFQKMVGRCPKCRQSYPSHVKFCRTDGTPIVRRTRESDKLVFPVASARPPKSLTRKDEVVKSSERRNISEVRDHISSKLKSFDLKKISVFFGIIAGLIFLSIIFAPTSSFFRHLGYFLTFLILWALLIYLIFVIFSAVVWLFKFVTFGSIVLAVILFLTDEPAAGIVFAIIGVVGLAIMLGIALGVLAIIAGPGALLGFATHKALGDNTFSAFLGIIVFIGVTILIYYVTTKFLLPFIIGAGASFIAGTLASKIAALIFALKFGHYYTRDISRIRDISAVLDYIKDFFRIGTANYIIVFIGSFAFGIFMVVASLSEDADE